MKTGNWIPLTGENGHFLLPRWVWARDVQVDELQEVGELDFDESVHERTAKLHLLVLGDLHVQLDPAVLVAELVDVGLFHPCVIACSNDSFLEK